MSEGDRLVDALREGIDCVVRVGKLRDSDMAARRPGELEEVTCAAPAYLQRFGTPQSSTICAITAWWAFALRRPVR